MTGLALGNIAGGELLPHHFYRDGEIGVPLYIRYAT